MSTRRDVVSQASIRSAALCSLLAGCVVRSAFNAPTAITTVASSGGSQPIMVSSNQERTAFYVDGEKVGVGRTMRILVADGAHTLAAEPAGYVRKEEVIRPPYDDLYTHRFTFLVEERVGGGDVRTAHSGSGSSTVRAEGVTDVVRGQPQPSSVALIVGIGRYRDVIEALGADKDAERYRTLATQTLGVAEEHVKLLVNDHATRGDIDDGLQWIKETVPAGGRVYFFFSGHGAPDTVKGTPYVVPYDGNPASLERTGLALDVVLERLQETPAAETLAVVDACFSGSGGRSVLPRGARPLVLAKPPIAGGTVSLLSASTGPQIAGPAADDSGGLFTQSIVEGLGQAQADVDGDGRVTLAELYEWVRPRVQREAKKARREQVPGLAFGKVNPARFVLASGLTAR